MKHIPCDYCDTLIHFRTINKEKLAFESQPVKFVPTGDFDSEGEFWSEKGKGLFRGKKDHDGRKGYRLHTCSEINKRKATASAKA